MATRGTRAAAAAAALLIVIAVALWSRAGGVTDAPRLVVTADQNVLLITIDTLRADALGSYGGRAATPNLDRLAASGLRFTFAHAHAVVTLPSHASILTGRYPFDHGVRDNAGFRLSDEVDTLAEAARRAGMATGAFVGAFPLDRQFGLAQGFDVYSDVGGRGAGEGDFVFTERRAEEVVADARAWIDRQQGRWLAWVHVFDPHAGYAPPPPFDEQYRGHEYAGEVAYVDYALGPLLDAVQRGARPTTVIVTADHGEGLGDHGERTHGVFAYESTLRVPLIVAQAGVGLGTSRGAVLDESVGHIDILPTIAGLTGIPVPQGLPGRSLTDLRKDERRVVYFEAMTPMLKRGWAPLRGVLSGHEKYVDLPLEELYDLADDPGELQNLVPSSGERLAGRVAELSALGAPLPGEQQDETAEVRARLESLGYVAGGAPRKARYTEEDDPKRLIDVDRLMMEGIELHVAGRTAEAIAAYRQVLERRPDMGLAYRRLAYIQWENGATTEAIATLTHGLERIGPDLEMEIRLGTYLAESGAAAAAIPMLERATSADPRHAEALNALGIAYAQAGRAADALRTFERILAFDTRDAFAHENIGTVHLQTGNLRAAKAAFDRSVANDPKSSRAHAGLGVVAIRSGQPGDAIEHWRRAVALDPGNFDALYNLGTELANAGRVAEARPYLEQFVATAPAGYARDSARIRQMLAAGRR